MILLAIHWVIMVIPVNALSHIASPTFSLGECVTLNNVIILKARIELFQIHLTTILTNKQLRDSWKCY